MTRGLLLFAIVAAEVSGDPLPSETIQDVLQRLSDEAASDMAVYDEAGGWCQRKLKDVGSTVDSMQSDQAELSADIEALLDDNRHLLLEMRDLCDAIDQAYETRRAARRAEEQALADALRNDVGGRFLAVRQGRSPDVSGGPADDLCMAALGIVDQDWRQKAKAACQTAKGGSLRDAADQVEALEDAIREALQAKRDEHEECVREHEEANVAAAGAADQSVAEEGVVKSDSESTSAALADVQRQAAAAQQAKAELSGIDADQHEVMQKIRAASVHDEPILWRAASQAQSPASAKISEAVQQANKLADAAVSYDDDRRELVQKVGSALDGVQRAAARAAIPLRMLRAEDEEAAINAKEGGEEIPRMHQSNCDLNNIQARESQLKEYLTKLGAAAESLAWSSLR